MPRERALLVELHLREKHRRQTLHAVRCEVHRRCCTQCSHARVCIGLHTRAGDGREVSLDCSGALMAQRHGCMLNVALLHAERRTAGACRGALIQLGGMLRITSTCTHPPAPVVGHYAARYMVSSSGWYFGSQRVLVVKAEIVGNSIVVGRSVAGCSAYAVEFDRLQVFADLLHPRHCPRDPCSH